MIKMKKILKTRYYKKWGYVLYYYITDEGTDYDFEMCSAFTLPDLHYLGNKKDAYFLCKTKGLKPQPRELPKVTNREMLNTLSVSLKAKNFLTDQTIMFDTRTCSIGWCEKEQKWYGWSHRAIFGFGIGSEIKKGDVAYQPDNKENFAFNLESFWIPDNKDFNEEGYKIIHIQTVIDVLDPKKQQKGLGVAVKTRTEFSGKQEGREGYTNEYFKSYPKVWGKGEWTAKTLEDAKQMAQEFAKGVS